VKRYEIVKQILLSLLFTSVHIDATFFKYVWYYISR